MKKGAFMQGRTSHALWADRRSGGALVLCAVTFRTFMEAVIHMPGLGNGSWAAILLGLLPGLPVVSAYMLIRRWEGERRDGLAVKLACCLWVPILLLDGAEVLGTLAASADFAAANAASQLTVLFATAAGLFLLCLCGMGAVSGTAMVYLRLALLLAIVVLAVQIPRMRPGWLAPMPGAEWDRLGKAGLRLGSITALAAPLPLIMAPEEDRRGRTALWGALIGGAAAAVMAVCCSMMTPALPDGPDLESFRLDTVLSNGRSPLALQFPIILIWFGGLFLTLGYETGMCIRCAGLVLEGVKPWILCALAAITLPVLHVVLDDGWKTGREIWCYGATAAPMILWTAGAAIKRRGKKCGG